MLLCLIVGIGSMNAKDIASGTFKNGGTWKISDQGELYVDAVTVPDYSYCGPWDAYSNYVKTLRFSSKITTIGKNAFYHMFYNWSDANDNNVIHKDGIREVRFDKKSSGNVIIKDGAFEDCRNLAFFDFSYVSEIGKSAFKDCQQLDDITLPAITKIDDNAFDRCYSLFGETPSMYITVPIKPTISNVMDHNYVNLGLRIEDAGKSICIVVPPTTSNQYPSQIWDSRNNVYPHGRIYPGCLERTYNADHSNNGYGSETGVATTIWWYVDGRHLYVNYEYGIPDFASPADAPWYSYRGQVTDVTLTGGRTIIIGKNAFANFTRLTTIYNSDRITEIHEGAFKECTVLGGDGKRIDFSNVELVGKEAFANCTSMKSIELPRVTTISEKAFKGCTAIVEISLGVSIGSIGSEAFANTLQQSTIIGNHFQHEIYMHENAPTTASDAFSGTYAAGTYLRVAGEYATSYLTDNTWSQFAITPSTLFPVSEPIIGGYGTWSIDKYGVLTINGSTPNYNSTEDVPWNIYRDYIYKIEITENSTYIGKNTFAYNEEGESKITTVTIPATVETIGENAFKNNDQIESVEAEGVQSIGNQAFENCSSLEQVKFGKDLSSIGQSLQLLRSDGRYGCQIGSTANRHRTDFRRPRSSVLQCSCQSESQICSPQSYCCYGSESRQS